MADSKSLVRGMLLSMIDYLFKQAASIRATNVS
jgi:hypothetical protein